MIHKLSVKQKIALGVIIIILLLSVLGLIFDLRDCSNVKGKTTCVVGPDNPVSVQLLRDRPPLVFNNPDRSPLESIVIRHFAEVVVIGLFGLLVLWVIGEIWKEKKEDKK